MSAEYPHGSVLIVDDDPGTRESLGDLIEAMGYRVTSASDGLDALRCLRQDREHLPSLILCDLMMPTMNGWVFRSQQQEDPGLAEIPTVMVSGKEDPKPVAAYLQAADYLEKPMDPERLVDILRKYCRSKLPDNALVTLH